MLYRTGIFYLLLSSFFCCITTEHVYAQTPADPFKKIQPLNQALQSLPLNEVKPLGWLRDELRKNLDGFTGHLDQLVPDLILQDTIYGSNRLTRKVKNKNVGAISDAGDWQVQFLWWNSETQSNWLDGYIRSAVLLKDTAHLRKIASTIHRLLATQDADGYIGIYDNELRYKFDNENGELWSKATLYRALLGWYEYTKDQTVLKAVEKAVLNVMQAYPMDQSHPFHSVNPDAGGLTHGLAFTDVLEQLFRITRKSIYMDYCLFMYKDFSSQLLNEDAQFQKLSDTGITLKGHGVHTYEHLRSVIAAYYASGNPALKNALNHFLDKIKRVTTPSGAPAGDEFIGGRLANGFSGYEYCSLQELMAGWISLLNKTAEVRYGDRAEHVLFNAAMGNTHPTESAICYLKQDNAFVLTGGNNGDTTDKHQTRYRYSPVHKEAAVCCVPNAGRIVPYYVQHMWSKDQDGLVATLLGPAELHTIVNKTAVSILEETSYPFEHAIRFTIQCKQPSRFAIKIRRPEWAISVKSSVPYTEKNGFLVFQQTWDRKTQIRISFSSATLKKETWDKEVYFQNGPLVLCHPIEAAQTITKTYPNSNLRESVYVPVQPVIYQYDQDPLIRSEKATNQATIKMVQTATGSKEVIRLVPMAHTILRQVTFKQKH